jgi:hypothetical protein
MHHKFIIGTALAATGLLSGAKVSHAQIVQNGSFETPAVAANGFEYDPSGGTWTFTGPSGIVNGTGSGFVPPSAAPAGQQVAFLQFGADGTQGSISQSITLPTTGAYQLTFDAGARVDRGGNTIFNVFLGSSTIGTVTTTTAQAYTPETFTFTASAGTYDFGFAFDPTQPAGDNTALLDVVQINPVTTTPVTTTPEPSSMALLGSGLLGIAPLVRRRRSK